MGHHRIGIVALAACTALLLIVGQGYVQAYACKPSYCCYTGGQSIVDGAYTQAGALPSSAAIGGLYDYMLTYSPYVYPADGAYAEDVLTLQDSSGNNHASYGWQKYQAAGVQSLVVYLGYSYAGSFNQAKYPGLIAEGDHHTYDLLYENPCTGATSNYLHAYLDNGVSQDICTVIDWTPQSAYINGFTNDGANQMPGGYNNKQTNANEHVYGCTSGSCGSGSWYDFMSYSSNYWTSRNPEIYLHQLVSSTQQNIWDNRCAT